MISELSYAETYPLARSGGLFLAIVGAGIFVGGTLPRFRVAALATSGLLAGGLTTVLARQLTAPFGAPTALQVWSLAGAVAVEALLIALVVHKFRTRGVRTVTLALMLVVGIHFVPMTMAFGPAMQVLAVLVCLCSASGLLVPRLSLNVLWVLDGLAKLVVGVFMWSAGV